MAAVTENLRTLKVTGRHNVAEGVVLLQLADGSGQPLPAWAPGAHIELHLASGIIRQYSLLGHPTATDTYEIAVLREEMGRGGSVEIHRDLTLGASVTVRDPRSRFPVPTAPSYVFIAGGIGITPILPMIREASLSGVAWTAFYTGRSRASMAFIDRLEAMSATNAVTIAPRAEAPRLDLLDILDRSASGSVIVCCGPPSLLDAIEQAARGRDVTVATERFAGSVDRTPTSEPDGQPFELVLNQSNVTLSVAANQTIMESIQESTSINIFSCGEGYCGSCEVSVLEGKPQHHDTVLSEAERSAGDVMMLCVGRSRGPRLVVDL